MSEPQSRPDLAGDIVEAPTRDVLLPYVESPPPRTPSSWLAAGAAALVIALVGIVLVAIGRDPAGRGLGADPNAAADVYGAAHKTLAQHSAKVTITGSMTAGGRNIPITGSGVVDFATATTSLTMDMQAGTASVAETELMVGGHMYLAMVVNGQDISPVTHGRHWISLPVAQQANQLGSGDPLTQLTMLAARDNTVTSLGTSTIDGVKVSGYEITVSRAQMQKGMQKMLALLKLSPAERVQFDRMAAKLRVNPPTIDAWFDSNKLLHKMRMKMSLTGAVSVSGTISMTFGNYGVPVHVTAPRGDDVIGFADYLRLVQAAGVTVP